jgi:O-antigen ligase
VWVPVGLGVTLLCAIAVVIGPRRPSGPAALALGGLLGVGVLSLASSTWSESVESAVVSANRWLIYGALLLLALALVSHERRAAVLLAATSVGIVAVAVSVLARMLGGDPASLFLGGRLNSPLGYINGEGCLFALGVWPFVALAESRRALLAGAGAAIATLLACLAMLSQSRGTALAILGSLILVLALVPGRARRAYAVLVIAGGVALAAPDLLRVYHDAAGGPVASGDPHAAARAAVLAALAAGAAWATLIAAWTRMESGPSGRRLAPLGSWLLGAAAVLAIALGIASAHRIERDVSHQWRAFIHLGEPAESRAPSAAASTRLLSGAGNRYDYWRIAWHVFEGHPLAGVGAGNYARPYYERRATTEDIVQPHSLELQTLSELGLAGLLLLGCFIAGTLWGAVRMRGAARASPLQQALLTAGLGMFTAWLTQASVDWMALLPGLTAIALIAVTILIWPGGRPLLASERPREPARAHRRAALALGVAGVTIVLIATGASLSRQGLADAYRSRAQRELQRDPAAALTDANRSLSIDADATATYYAKAAALARFDQASAAQATLAAALEREPRNFVTWTLLGDIAVRELNFTAARADYTRAHELNPRNQILGELAQSPRRALP